MSPPEPEWKRRWGNLPPDPVPTAPPRGDPFADLIEATAESKRVRREYERKRQREEEGILKDYGRSKHVDSVEVNRIAGGYCGGHGGRCMDPWGQRSPATQQVTVRVGPAVKSAAMCDDCYESAKRSGVI